jgi:hypothetical protein
MLAELLEKSNGSHVKTSPRKPLAPHALIKRVGITLDACPCMECTGLTERTIHPVSCRKAVKPAKGQLKASIRSFHPCCRGSKDPGAALGFHPEPGNGFLTATGGFTLSVAPKGVGEGSPTFALGMQDSAGPHSGGAKPFNSVGNAHFQTAVNPGSSRESASSAGPSGFFFS